MFNPTENKKGRKIPLVIGRIVLIAVSLLLLALVFSQGLAGEFILDDLNSIAFNEQIRIEALTFEGLQQGLSSGQVGMFGRPLAMLSFSLDYYFSGYDVAAFKRTSVAIHLLCFMAVLGLGYTLLSVLAGRGKLQSQHVFPVALCSAIIWAIHPLQVSTVAYVVQRMTLLSGFFVVISLCLYVYWRNALSRGTWLVWVLPVAIVAMASLGFLSKENAILVPVYILLIEFFVYGKAKSALESRYQRALYVAALVCFCMVVWYLQFGLEWFAEKYQMRPFTLAERVLTESRVLLSYINWIAMPALGNFGLFHDDVVVSRGLLDPATTVFAIISWVLLLLAAIKYREKAPWFGFCVAFYIAGHVLESTIIPLELVYEHRNYLPSYAVVLLMVLALQKLTTHMDVKSITAPLLLVVLIYLSVLTSIRLKEWSDRHLQALSSVARHPQSPRSHWELARWYLESYSIDKARGFDDKPRFEQGLAHAKNATAVSRQFTTSLFGLITMPEAILLPENQQWQDELGLRLKTYPYRHENDTSFKLLLECAMAESSACGVKQETVVQLFEAVLSNPLLMRRQRANLYQGYGIYLHEFGNKQRSYELLQQAAEVIVSKSLYQNLVGVALELKQKQDAQLYLLKLKSVLSDEERGSDMIVQFETYIASCCEQDLSIKIGF